jgi:hypothetical protein
MCASDNARSVPKLVHGELVEHRHCPACLARFRADGAIF